MLLDHRAAGTGGNDDVVIGLKVGNYRFRDCRGIAPVAGIIGRLSATGLALRHGDRAAGIFQKLDRGKADARSE